MKQPRHSHFQACLIVRQVARRQGLYRLMKTHGAAQILSSSALAQAESPSLIAWLSAYHFNWVNSLLSCLDLIAPFMTVASLMAKTSSWGLILYLFSVVYRFSASLQLHFSTLVPKVHMIDLLSLELLVFASLPFLLCMHVLVLVNMYSP